jgi:L-ascorbate metabolism protein UlaG (beta-lactamase superfamily)
MTPARSDHFNGKTFFQSHHGVLRLRDFWKWRLTHQPKPWPSRVTYPLRPVPPQPQADEIIATWIGHATFLLQSAHGNVLIDPVFSDRASPVTWAGPRRVHPPGVAFDALPRIDAVLLSHDHYDHCDVVSLRAIARRHDAVFISPLRHRDLLTAAGARRVVELDWWETHTLSSGISITLTPTKHWSNRFGSPRNHRLWGGFYLKIGPRQIWFAGDTGYDAEMFRAVRARCGSPDLALVPIGAYEPRWFMAPMHVNPAEAVQLHRDIGARLSIAMHWGTFQLTDEGREEPLTALAAALHEAGVRSEEFRVVDPGESVVV